MFGTGMRFHHNWVHNFNDDAITLNGSRDIDDAQVFQNVYTQCLTAISYGQDNNVSGHCAVYRNLIDMRQPTAGIRPRHDGDVGVWRQGGFYKSQNVDGPLDLFHNTVLAYAAGGTMPPSDSGETAPFIELTGAAFNHYGHGEVGPLQSLNNIFVAVTPPGVQDRPVAFLRGEPFLGASDGNCDFRTGHGQEFDPPFLRIPKLPNPAGHELPEIPGMDVATLADCTTIPAHDWHLAPQPPGFEDASIDLDPAFRAWSEDGKPAPGDDFRLSDGSPAQRKGLKLEDNFPDLDTIDPLSLSWLPFLRPAPDMGCYDNFGTPLAVGVEGRKRFPATPWPGWLMAVAASSRPWWRRR